MVKIILGMDTSVRGQGYKMPEPAAAILGRTNVLFVLAPKNFRDEEFQQPYERLKQAGAAITIASVGVKEAVGMLGTRVPVEVDVSDVGISDCDVLILVGGSGVVEYELDKNNHILNLVREAFSQGKIVGAICLAPRILAAAGVVDGRYITCWRDPELIEMLQAAGAIYVREPVVHDGHLITADGPASADRFTRTIIDAITSPLTPGGHLLD